MSILIGSARSKGFFEGKQVSEQAYYTHMPEGYWLGFAPKTKGDKLAKAMREACDNNLIIYSQPYREQAWNEFTKTGSIAKINKRVYTDCSALVRLCIRQAFGIELPNFNTASEPDILRKSKLFEEPVKITSANQLKLGMILVTPKKGHTAIVTELNTPVKATHADDHLSLESVAKAVIQGKYGNGEERKKRLIKAGYDPEKVQKIVNKLLR